MQSGEPLEAVITCGMHHANVVGVLASSWHSWRCRSTTIAPQARAHPAPEPSEPLWQAHRSHHPSHPWRWLLAER
jgi:hypothetical protein